jgi:hypothetical protein
MVTNPLLRLPQKYLFANWAMSCGSLRLHNGWKEVAILLGDLRLSPDHSYASLDYLVKVMYVRCDHVGAGNA